MPEISERIQSRRIGILLSVKRAVYRRGFVILLCGSPDS